MLMQKFFFSFLFFFWWGANKVNLGNVQMENTKILFYITDNNKRYLPCHCLLQRWLQMMGNCRCLHHLSADQKLGTRTHGHPKQKKSIKPYYCQHPHCSKLQLFQTPSYGEQKNLLTTLTSQQKYPATWSPVFNGHVPSHSTF